MSGSNRAGVLLMAHGTPSTLDEMPEYLRLVRGGREAPPELIAEMRHHYEASGGPSPLTDITLAQADALRRRLGEAIPIAVGMRNWKPFIADALMELASAGVTRVIGIPLAPQFSTLSVVKYFDAATRALPAGACFEGIESFCSHPLLLRAFAERLGDLRPHADEEIIFTAHSLPARAIKAGDRYVNEVMATARGVAAQCGLSRHRVAYQSAGRTAEPWIGLDLSDLIRHRVRSGTRRFIVVPIGFVCDHTEILFDVDVEARATAEAVGATLRRTESLNTSPTFIAMLEDLVRSRL
jgi:ferrochelatase